MPKPVSSPNSSYYDPNAQFTPADGASPANSSSERGAPREVNMLPVTIVGDAGAQHLVQRHDAARIPRDCSTEGASAAVSCGKTALTAATAIIGAPTAVGSALLVAMTLADGISCAKDLLAYRDCKNQ